MTFGGTSVEGIVRNKKYSKEEVSEEEDAAATTTQTTKVWKQTQPLRTLLHELKFPSKAQGTNSRKNAQYYVTANEWYIKTRMYYKLYFTNDVVTVHPEVCYVSLTIPVR